MFERKNKIVIVQGADNVFLFKSGFWILTLHLYRSHERLLNERGQPKGGSSTDYGYCAVM